MSTSPCASAAFRSRARTCCSRACARGAPPERRPRFARRPSPRLLRRRLDEGRNYLELHPDPGVAENPPYMDAFSASLRGSAPRDVASTSASLVAGTGDQEPPPRAAAADL